ncbi:MAG: hypothetical protein WBV61_07490 [Rhodanobacteraceae bacterium]
MIRRILPSAIALLVVVCGVFATAAFAKHGHHSGSASQQSAMATDIAELKSRVAQLQARLAAPELGQQMLELQIRHDRLWWAGDAGNWNLAYYMTGELGEALQRIEETNGEARELQPQMLAKLMPSMMDPAVKQMQEALARKDKAAFEKAFDNLSASCTACHQVAGNTFLVIQRPSTPLLDNLRYAPAAGK